MRHRVSRVHASLAAAALALVLSAAAAHAALTTYVVTLDGPSESPPVASPGIGAGQVEFDDVAHTLRVQVTWSGLTGPTTVAHIHAPTAAALTGTVGVAVGPSTMLGFPAGVTFGSYDHTFNTLDNATYTSAFRTNLGGGTAAGAETAIAQAMAAGKAYLNIHSVNFPGGEIRGFLVPAGATPSRGATWGKIKALYR